MNSEQLMLKNADGMNNLQLLMQRTNNTIDRNKYGYRINLTSYVGNNYSIFLSGTNDSCVNMSLMLINNGVLLGDIMSYEAIDKQLILISRILKLIAFA